MKNKMYIKWITTQPCSVEGCQYRGLCDPHHRIGHNRREDYGNRVPDTEAMPLCPNHHDELHAHGWRTFEAKYNLNQLKVVIKLLSRFISIIESLHDSPI
jgi:hypothetical protein